MTQAASKSIGRDTLIYIPGRVIPAVMALATVYVLTNTRIFEPQDVGRYDLAMRAVMFMCTLCTLWLSLCTLRLYPAYEHKGQLGAYYHAMSLLTWIGIALGLALLLGLWALGPETLVGSYRDLLKAAAVIFIGQSLFEIGQATARARSMPVLFSAAAVANSVVRLPAGLLLAWYVTHDISGMLWGTGLVVVFTCVAFSRMRLLGARFRLDPQEKAIAREALAYGIPIGATLVLNFLLSNSDRYLLNSFRNPAEVGAFSVVSMLVDQPMGLVFQTLMLAVFPAVYARYEKEGRQPTERLVGQLTRVYLILALPACALLASASQPILHVLTPRAEYREAYVVAPWLAFAAFAYGLNYYAGLGLHVSKSSNTLLLITLVSVIVNLGINIAIIPASGYMGCGAARLVSNTVLVAAAAAFSHRYLRWAFPVRSLVRAGLAAGCAGVGVLALQRFIPTNLLTLILLLGGGAIAYGILLVLSGELKLHEIRGAFGRGPGERDASNSGNRQA